MKGFIVDFSFSEQINIRNKGWPFQGYFQQVEELRKHFGHELIFSGRGFSAANRTEKTPMGFIYINQDYLELGNPDSLYPHSLVFSNGSAENLKDIGFVGTKKRLDRIALEIEPTFIVSEDKKEYVRKLRNAIRLLDFHTIYWNLSLLEKALEDTRFTNKEAKQLSETGLYLGMFNER